MASKIAKRPHNNELAEHFHQNHDIDKDLDVVILEDNLYKSAERLFKENQWICRLQSLQPQGLNIDQGSYTKEMKSLGRNITKSQKRNPM